MLYFTGEAQAAEREDDEFDEDMYGEGDEDEDPDFEPKVSSRFLSLFGIFVFVGGRTRRTVQATMKRPSVKRADIHTETCIKGNTRCRKVN